MKFLLLISFVFSLFILSLACASDSNAPATPGPQSLEATVQAVVAAAMPRDTPTPRPDTNATIAASIVATAEAEVAPTPTLLPTPDLDATVEARLAAAIAAIPTPTPVPTDTPVPTAIPTTTPVPTATLAPTVTPSPTPRPTPIPPTVTPVPTRVPVLSLSEMVKEVRPAVVRIETRTGRGSGVIFETQGGTGYVITNYHVVEGYGQVNVVVNDAATYSGTVRGADHVRDLAVVSICCGSFESLEFGNASRLEPGDEVVAIGYALGLSGEATITRGIVSAMRYDSSHRSDVIQTDAAINPGNSGGPMLSLAGEILGINTFRYDKSESGRPAEGVGFAISEKTVRPRIPSLKSGYASPASTPTHRPRATPSAATEYGFGPVDGELRHDESDGLIKTEYADVSMSDLIASATFINPYSVQTGSWDYGFIIRNSGIGDSAKFIYVVVTSRGQWEVAWRYGSGTKSEVIGEGRLGRFDTGAGGENRLWIAAFDDRGAFFVNGEFVTLLDLSDVTGPGDVAVATGTFGGHEVDGSVTRFEDFQIVPLKRGYGPASGRLEKEPGFVAEHDSGLWTRDLVAEAEFARPQGFQWDFGFMIRAPDSNQLEVVGITGKELWFHNTREIHSPAYTDIADGSLRQSGATLGSRNHLLLFALDDVGMLFLNDKLVAKLDLSHNQAFGAVSLMGYFFRNHQGSTRFENFNVWTP